MKTLVLDFTAESDRHFNDPLREQVGKTGEFEVWTPGNILSVASLREFGSIVIGGVPANIERYPFGIGQESVTPIKEAGVPVLGICLGHQLIGQGFNAELKFFEEQEEGSITVELTPDGLTDDLLLGLPAEFKATTMHKGSIPVPEDTLLLASSKTCLNQIMVDSSGLMRGVQFHPERSGEVGEAMFYNLARIASNHFQLADAA